MRYYGHAGAGVLPVASGTGRVLLGRRAAKVREPGTWGGWGGALRDPDRPVGDEEEDGAPPDASPAQAALREFREESGWEGEPVALEPLYVYRDRAAGFVYHNFLLVLPGEFAPRLDPKETAEARWTRWGRWPLPLHFGLSRLLDDPASRAAIRGWLRRLAPPTG